MGRGEVKTLVVVSSVFYTNFISSTPLLRIFYSWSKQKRIRTVRQYSGSLAHPRGMYYNGKEGVYNGDIWW